jgi:hypothetical protein
MGGQIVMSWTYSALRGGLVFLGCGHPLYVVVN